MNKMFYCINVFLQIKNLEKLYKFFKEKLFVFADAPMRGRELKHLPAEEAPPARGMPHAGA